MLARVIRPDQRDWCAWLPGVMAAYRATPHESTGYSPNALMFGRENYMPIDLILGDSGDDTLHPDSADDYVHDLQGRLRDSYHLVRQHLGKTARRRKEQYDVKVKPTHFAPGDWVWYFCPRKRVGLSPKWQKWYNGPFLVVKAIDSHTFVIQKSKRSKSVVVHKDKLKLYIGETPKTWLDLQGTELGDQPATPAQPESTPADGERQPGSSRRRPSPTTTHDDVDGEVPPPAEGRRPTRARRQPMRLRDYVNYVNNLICDSNSTQLDTALETAPWTVAVPPTPLETRHGPSPCRQPNKIPHRGRRMDRHETSNFFMASHRCSADLSAAFLLRRFR
jgi:hypothetical protein